MSESQKPVKKLAILLFDFCVHDNTAMILARRSNAMQSSNNVSIVNWNLKNCISAFHRLPLTACSVVESA